ncbi:hypothetical protein HMPREF0083_05909 [Aneurinibacillus aneurinilyticus ATCC 12856]|uniref:Uncharacterized protein n=1 Tax=Aneurinibacillus aneurinilyticus ATCC 12856 TaxID=649747 RepID=U1XY08_ANEAE|nr:hypothetical protein HMPREF0083_05909 [Aneurinibacillus aneurinilyticus ATCC 12856]
MRSRLAEVKSGLAVPPGWGKKRSSTLRGGRRTDARLGHGVVAIHSGSYWIINTLGYWYLIYHICFSNNSRLSVNKV